MQFSKVAGHAELKRKLIQSVLDNRVPHAQLFYGPEGNGKLALALAYANYISCEDRQDDDSCGSCPSCQKYGKLVHPDLHFVLPVNTTRSVPKDPVSDDFIGDWRTAFLGNPYITINQWYQVIGIENKQGIINKWESKAITHKLSLKTYESEYKIMIIWFPEKMNLTASNKLLKLIEEPPPMTVFLLVSENPETLIPTIRSRTQLIRVPGIPDKDLKEALEDSGLADGDEVNNAVQMAGGNYNKAIEYLNETEDNRAKLDLFMRIMRIAFSVKLLPEVFAWVEELHGMGREKQKSFLVYALRMVRENLMLNRKQAGLAHLTNSEMEFSEKFHPFIHIDNAPAISEELNQASLHIEANANARIVFLDFALKLVKLIR
jgi:DNA polymerase III subunit delta'